VLLALLAIGVSVPLTALVGRRTGPRLRLAGVALLLAALLVVFPPASLAGLLLVGLGRVTG
jgi:hypothetical protein